MKLDRILPNPDQPRKHFDQGELESLAASIRENGVILPVVVYKNGDGFYHLVDGERRWRAAKMAGLSEIPVSIRTSGDDAGILAMVANLQREDLSPIEEGQAYQKMRDAGMSLNDIALRMGIAHATVNNRLNLLKLEPKIQDEIKKSLLPTDKRAVDALLSIKNSDHRVKLACKLAREGCKVKTVIAACEKFNAAIDAQPAGKSLPALAHATLRTGKVDGAKWNLFKELGKVPPWTSVIHAASDTCERCPLRDSASSVICRDCPAVMLVAALIQLVNDGH
jgi:ParB family chromosome partitioning protein